VNPTLPTRGKRAGTANPRLLPIYSSTRVGARATGRFSSFVLDRPSGPLFTHCVSHIHFIGGFWAALDGLGDVL